MNHIIAVLCFLLLPAALYDRTPDSQMEGTWVFVKEKSTDLATWRYRTPEITISHAGDQVIILHNWMEGTRIAHTDTFAFSPGAKPTIIPVRSKPWTENWYMGVLAKPGSNKSVSGRWLVHGTALQMVSTQTVVTSQGETEVTTTSDYRLDPSGPALIVTETRSSRPTPVVMVFRRSGPH